MIRVLTQEDAAAAARLHAASMPDDPWSIAAFETFLSQPGVAGLGADADGRLCGLILIRTAAGESEVLTLAVDPAMRRRGIGRALLDAALAAAAAAGAATMFLEVAASNAAAAGLYAARGFRQTGVRHGYYRRASGGADDARVLALGLAGPDRLE